MRINIHNTLCPKYFIKTLNSLSTKAKILKYLRLDSFKLAGLPISDLFPGIPSNIRRY